MKILGIDPGMAIVGYSIVEFDGNACTLLHSGSIQTSKNAKESARLLEIFNDMKTIVEMYKPDIASIEKLFFFRNQTTVMPVAHARGVILTVLEMNGIPVFEYTPMEVKQVLTGYGRADKKTPLLFSIFLTSMFTTLSFFEGTFPQSPKKIN